MIAIIGDIHGCYHTFIELYNNVKRKYKNIDIYSIGDLVDRGNYSFNVFQFVVENKIKFTPGNHEFMFLHGLSGLDTYLTKSWIYNGRIETLQSYLGKEEFIPSHIQYIKNSPLYYNLDDCFISHAGISKKYENEIPIDNFWHTLDEVIRRDIHTDKGVLWLRDEILNLGKLQIVGHTKQDMVKYVEESNALYIDTGCETGNYLTCVIIEKSEIIDVLQVKTHIEDVS